MVAEEGRVAAVEQEEEAGQSIVEGPEVYRPGSQSPGGRAEVTGLYRSYSSVD